MSAVEASAEEQPRLTWRMAATVFTRPQPVTIPMVTLFAIIPFYLVIGAYMPASATHRPELDLDRALPILPAWSGVYASLFCAALPREATPALERRLAPFLAAGAFATYGLFVVRRTRIVISFLAAALVVACGGGGNGGGSQQPEMPPPTMPLDFAVTGMAVIKVRSGTDGVAILEEKLRPLLDPGPERRLTLLDSGGALRGRYSPPGSSLIDFALHPSGEITVAVATARTVSLLRIDRFAVASTEFPLLDAQAPGDPFYDDGGMHDDGSMVPLFTRDAVRLAPVGESVVVALRTGRNAVVAYRFDYAKPAGFARAWRTLVEPGLSMFGTSITTGTFDTFGQLENHFHVHVDADATGNVAVAVVGKPGLVALFPAHADYFHQPTGIAIGLLVSRLAPDGQRLGTTLVDTVQSSELHGLRLNGNDIGLVGRVFSERRDDGGGWNAYAAHVDRASGALLGYRVVDVNQGEVLFDIAPLAQGRFLVAGAAGYTQNPTGGSISEQTTPLLAVLESDGTLRQRIDFNTGPRQNQLRSIVPRGGNWLLGGLVNGPGTHSGDGNPALIAADGFAREIAIAAP